MSVRWKTQRVQKFWTRHTKLLYEADYRYTDSGIMELPENSARWITTITGPEILDQTHRIAVWDGLPVHRFQFQNVWNVFRMSIRWNITGPEILDQTHRIAVRSGLTVHKFQFQNVWNVFRMSIRWNITGPEILDQTHRIAVRSGLTVHKFQNFWKLVRVPVRWN
jgi:hypothetical protein